jgi:hypothetical protein
MFRFSTDQRHALRHGIQDFGKLTIAMLFLGGAIGLQPLTANHPSTLPAYGKATVQTLPSQVNTHERTDHQSAKLFQS